MLTINSLLTYRDRENGRHFPDDIFKCIFLNETIQISINISPKFIPKGPINNIPALFQIMVWRRPGDKPLSEPMMVSLLTQICVTQAQWANRCGIDYIIYAMLMHWSYHNLAISYSYKIHIDLCIHSKKFSTCRDENLIANSNITWTDYHSSADIQTQGYASAFFGSNLE